MEAERQTAAVMARWGHIHSYLFPWMREEFDPCSEALQRLIIVLDTISVRSVQLQVPQ